MGDFTHLKNKKGELIAQPLPQPTLPNLSVDDDLDDNSSYTRTSPSNYYSDTKDYPPMPAYNQPYSTHQAPDAFAYYNPSQVTLGQDDPYQQQIYESDADSTMYLQAAAAPVGQQPHGTPLQNSNANLPSYVADPYDVYQGRARANESARRSPPVSSARPSSVGLAYDDVPEYESYASPDGSRVNSSSSAQMQYGYHSNYPNARKASQ